MRIIKNPNRSRLIGAATKRIPCDLTIKNVKLVNVLTGEIYPASVDIIDGIIVHVQEGESCDSNSLKVIDGKGQYLMPGLIDIHMHIESSMLTPENFGREAILHGTTSVMVDPHEIGNVSGIEGIAYMLENAKKSPVRQFNLAPSCIPADPDFETSPSPIFHEQIGELLDLEGVWGIAEVMNYDAVIQDKPFMREILHEGRKREMVIQGHCSGVHGRSLSAYHLAGIMNTHTVSNGEDIRECLRMGMHANMQSSSLSNTHLLQEMVTGTKGMRYTDFLSVCTDDVHAKDMHETGHINSILKRLLAMGVDEIDAIRWCTYNPAKETGFTDLGAVAVGYVADLQLVEKLDGRDPVAVFVGGKQVVEEGQLLLEPVESSDEVPFCDTVNLKEVQAEDFYLEVSNPNCEIAVIECENRNRMQFELRWEQFPIVKNHVELSSQDDLCYLAVFNRYGLERKCIAVYHGFGLKEGAMATTISHDCHNVIVAYRDFNDAAVAVNRLRETGGGIVAVKNGEVIGEVQLPIAGLMSVLPCVELVKQLDDLAEKLKEIWMEENPSLLKLSILTLTVIPSIAITDTTLVDGRVREKIPAVRVLK